MKKFLAIMLIVAMLLSFAACSNDKDAGGQIETDEWRGMYEKALQEYISAGINISSAYVGDLDGDTIPEIAFSTNPYFEDIPSVVLNYDNGEVVELTGFLSEDSGSSVTQEILFIKGTTGVVYRSYGNTTGTFGANEVQKIYNISNPGEYGIYSEKQFDLSDNLAEEFSQVATSGGHDVSKYQQEIFLQMDAEIEKAVGRTVSLIAYKDIAKSFTTDSDEVVKYFNNELDINLMVKQDENTDEKAFNVEKYAGVWVSVNDDGTQNHKVELYVDEAEGNKATFEFSYIRLYGFGPKMLEVDSNGKANFEFREDKWTYVGQLVLSEENIKVVLTEVESLYSEIVKETLNFKKADLFEENATDEKNEKPSATEKREDRL